MNIEEIHKEIQDLFKKHKYSWITCNLPMDSLHRWSIATARRLKIKEVDFQENLSELFWSLSHVQLALGYALIAGKTCKFPKGVEGEAFHEKDIPNMMGLPEMHFWYHLFCCIECIYRCWERLALILKKACYHGCPGKFYFDGIVNELIKDERYNQNPKINELKKQIKNWNSIAGIRNELSHETSSPFKRIQIEGDIAEIRGPIGEVIFKLNYSSKNLIEETTKIKDKYLQLLPAIKAVSEFIDSIK